MLLVLLGTHYHCIVAMSEPDLYFFDAWAVHREHFKVMAAPTQRFSRGWDVLQPL
jgi:hypothetical protein